MNKYGVRYTSQFKKDLKAAIKQGFDVREMNKVIALIAQGTNEKLLCEKYSDHALRGKWKGYRECHIRPDWLLVYEIFENTMILSLTRTGSHSELFKI